MVGRNEGAHPVRKVEAQAKDVFAIDPVALQRLHAAISQPSGQLIDVAVENAEHHFFMVSHEEPVRGPGKFPPAQPVEDLGAARTAVNQVAKE